MTDVASVLRRFGGVASTSELRRWGISKRMLAESVFLGGIIRHRIGHYCLPETNEMVVEALRVGGRVCCVSAAALHGLRVLNRPGRLHVSVELHDSRFRARADSRVQFRPTSPSPAAAGPPRSGIRLHWDAVQLDQGSRHLVSVEDCLVQLIECVPALDAICVLDSALESPRAGLFTGLPLLDQDGLARVRSRVSQARATAVLDRATELSQAVGESVARCKFQDAGIPSQPQAPLPGGFRADLLIGRWLVFECNGEEAHSAPGAFDHGHARTAWLMAQGFHVVQFSHRQIVDDWPMVLSTVQLLMRRGQHLYPF